MSYPESMRRPHTSALLFSLSLALLAPMSRAQDTTPTAAQAKTAAALNTVTITDLPADHWAREAVGLVVKSGLITAFPDGTFRGNQPLTRYQAALILARALPQLDLGKLSPGEQTTITTAVAGLSKELTVIRQQVQLLSDLLGTQQGQLDTLKTGQQTEQSRVTALEQEVTSLRAQLTTLTGNYTALGTQFDALRVAQAQAELGAAPAPLQGPVQNPADVATQPDVPFAPQADVPAGIKMPQLAVGIFAGAGGVATQPGVSLDYRLPLGGLPLYAQVYGYTSLGGVKASGLGLNATYDFGRSGNDLRPYAYGGLGVSASEAWSTTGTGTDVFFRLGGGTEYRMASTFSLFADGYVTLYASNNGIGTGLTQDRTGGAGFGARGGIKLRF